MRDFVNDLKQLEVGNYPGISQVYLVIFAADYNHARCDKRHIFKLTNIEWDLLQEYLDFLVAEKYIHRDAKNKYSTLMFGTEKNGVDTIAKEFALNIEQSEQARQLLDDMASRQTNSNNVYNDVSLFIHKFRKYFSIKNPTDVLFILRAINKQYDNVNYNDLSAFVIKQAMQNNIDHAVIKKQVDEINVKIKRVIRLVRQLVKQNPEFIICGKVKRDKIIDFLKSHFYRFPEDSVPFEIIESELAKLDPPIILGA